MKTIGILGGMSWESTVEYYRIINTVVKEELGGLASARCLIYSLEFSELAAAMAEGDWDKIETRLTEAAVKLEKAGADFIIMATNTMHKMADALKAELGVPFLHIAEATADALAAEGIKKVGLLGTRPTMEMDFYSRKLAERGFEVLIPGEDERRELHRIIFEELCRGLISPASKKNALDIIQHLSERGATGIILGCTELGLLIKPEDTATPTFDTALIHARAAALKSLDQAQ